MSDNAHAGAVARQLAAVDDEDIPDEILDRREDEDSEEGEGDSEEGEA